MSSASITILGLTAFIACASAEYNASEDFPLVWLCLGLTVIALIISAFVVYRRPKELTLLGPEHNPEEGNETTAPVTEKANEVDVPEAEKEEKAYAV